MKERMVAETRSAFTGSCHCGNIRYRLFTAHQRDALALRAYRCSFCRRMGARYTSRPSSLPLLLAGAAGCRPESAQRADPDTRLI